MTEIENTGGLSLSALLEGLLFVAFEPVTSMHLATTLGKPVDQIEEGLKTLEVELKIRGLRLQRHAGRWQLTTAPQLAGLVEHFLNLEVTSHLSRAALETLAIIAYQQPITRPRVDAIRGVNSDGVLRSLLSKGLIQEIGRAEGPGRPILYGTTAEFLQYFGLSSLSELPPLNLPAQEGEGKATEVGPKASNNQP